MVTQIGEKLIFETKTQTAVFENGALTRLVSKLDGRVCVDGPAECPCAVVFQQNQTYELAFGEIISRRLSDTYAEVVTHSWYGDGVLQLSEDEETGDILARPSVYSDRPGVKGVRYDIRGIDGGLKAVLPVFQGVRLALDDPLLVGRRYSWPNGWESGFAIFEGEDGGGFWVWCEDANYHYKSLTMGTQDDPFRVGFGVECHGPIDNNLSAGGVTWRIAAFTGGWRAPASRYKAWLWAAYGLEAQRKKRPEWLYGLKLAVSFSPADIDLLRALEKRVDPKRVLIHVSGWRDDGYDRNYPHYDANETAKAMFAYGRERGFHIMPHTNSMQIDPGHPAYTLLRNMQLRDIDTKKVLGWAYDHAIWLKTDQAVDVPYSDYARVAPYNRKNNIMPTIHCGCSMWHSVLGEQLRHLVDDYKVDAAFVDVAFCAGNNANGLVEGRSHAEGVNDMLRAFSEIGGGLVVGGENANEVTIQGQSVGQMHLYESWHFSKPGLERTGGDCAVAHFLYGDLCRMFGYESISGKDENERMRMRIHADHHCIPTFNVPGGARFVEEPNETVDAMLTEAGL